MNDEIIEKLKDYNTVEAYHRIVRKLTKSKARV